MIYPVIKFPGGKRYLAEQIIQYFPKKINRYHEPMVGGGAIFCELFNQGRIKKAFLSDLNPWLMHIYQTLRHDPRLMTLQFQILKRKHKKCLEKFGSAEKFYYYVRKTINKDFVRFNKIPEASVLIYLNKTCYNGLFRFNKQGLFNSPFGKQEKPAICSDENIFEWGHALKRHVKFGCPHYMDNAKHVKEGDVVYFDPPYWPIKKTSFVEYNRNVFTKDDHMRLAKHARELRDEKNAYVFISNSNVPEIKKLYRDFDIEVVQAPRRINRNGRGRGNVEELLIITR